LYIRTDWCRSLTWLDINTT